jgi:hypothetical protein
MVVPTATCMVRRLVGTNLSWRGQITSGLATMGGAVPHDRQGGWAES